MKKSIFYKIQTINKKNSISFFLYILIVFTQSNLSFSQYIKLFDFPGSPEGNTPYTCTLISDRTFLYGTTFIGGTNNMGMIFKILPDGSGYSKLLDFAGTSNGRSPQSSLFYDGTFLYGTTKYGGTNDIGTIFKILPDGSGYLKLLDFSEITNGRWPCSALISDGTFLFGLTVFGGLNNMGGIFKIKTDGTGFSKLIDFLGVANGNGGSGGLISDGTFLYGMTTSGGAFNMGTIFKYTSAPLPIKLISYTAQCINNTAELKWITATETNNDYFTIERSGNGVDYTILSIIKGTGNSNQIISYKWTDNSPLMGMNYYRLKQTDYNGNFEYLGLISLKTRTIKNDNIMIYPTITETNITIENSAFSEGLGCMVTIYNSDGRLVRQQLMQKEKMVIDISCFKKGIYLVNISNSKDFKTFKLIKE